MFGQIQYCTHRQTVQVSMRAICGVTFTQTTTELNLTVMIFVVDVRCLEAQRKESSLQSQTVSALILKIIFPLL